MSPPPYSGAKRRRSVSGGGAEVHGGGATAGGGATGAGGGTGVCKPPSPSRPSRHSRSARIHAWSALRAARSIRDIKASIAVTCSGVSSRLASGAGSSGSCARAASTHFSTSSAMRPSVGAISIWLATFLSNSPGPPSSGVRPSNPWNALSGLGMSFCSTPTRRTVTPFGQRARPIPASQYSHGCLSDVGVANTHTASARPKRSWIDGYHSSPGWIPPPGVGSDEAYGSTTPENTARTSRCRACARFRSA